MDKKITVDEFMAQKKAAAKSSRLDPWTDDILTLKDNGSTQKQILEFLEANGIKVSQMTLSVFIRSRQQKQDGSTHTSLQEKKTAGRRQKGDQKQQPDVEQKEAERIRKLNDVHVGSNKFEWPPKDVNMDDLI